MNWFVQHIQLWRTEFQSILLIGGNNCSCRMESATWKNEGKFQVMHTCTIKCTQHLDTRKYNRTVFCSSAGSITDRHPDPDPHRMEPVIPPKANSIWTFNKQHAPPPIFSSLSLSLSPSYAPTIFMALGKCFYLPLRTMWAAVGSSASMGGVGGVGSGSGGPLQMGKK